jgi:putative dimethyl sulfoxide reductase chaperone
MKKQTGLYKLLSLGFQSPSKDLLATLKKVPLFSEALKNVTVEELAQEFTRLFSLSVAGGIPLYETEYGHKEVFYKTQKMADISGFYRAFGMEVSEDSHQRIDFIGAELELMDWLSLKEAHAKKKGSADKVKICHDAAAKFLNDHLGRWAPYSGDLISKEARLPFFKILGQTLYSFITKECVRFGITPDKVKGWSPPTPQEEPSCNMDDCSLMNT